jgi:hypothetical protein
MYISDNEDAEIVSTILKIQELKDIYKRAQNDAMNLRRNLEGMKVIIPTQCKQRMFTNHTNHEKQAHVHAKYHHESESEIVTMAQTEPPQKRRRGRPRKIKDSLELIRGDIDDNHDGKMQAAEYRKCNSEIASTNDDEFNNAVYSIEDDELYIKTKSGKLYDINTMQMKGWFNSYLKTNVWVQ